MHHSQRGLTNIGSSVRTRRATQRRRMMSWRLSITRSSGKYYVLPWHAYVTTVAPVYDGNPPENVLGGWSNQQHTPRRGLVGASMPFPPWIASRDYIAHGCTGNGRFLGAPHVAPQRIDRQHMEIVFPCLRLAKTLESHHSIIVGLYEGFYDKTLRRLSYHVAAGSG